MTAPRHLWSGDWRRESAAAAQELAGRPAPAEAPPATPGPSSSKPSTPSAAARALARMRSFRPRRAVLMALVLLIAAAVGYAATSSLVSSAGGGKSGTGNASSASSSAPTAAPGWLGVDTMSFQPGVMVVDVVPGSPADTAGLQAGDVITQIGTRPVGAPTDLESALAGMHAGQRIEIEYERGTISYTTHATLRARPANGP